MDYKNWNTFRIKPENLKAVEKVLKTKKIEYKVGEIREVNYYHCCSSCDPHPYMVRKMQMIHLPKNISGNKFHKILVEAGITPPAKEHIFLKGN